METTTSPRWVNRVAAADYLGVSLATLYRYIASGAITAHNFPGADRPRFDLNEIDAVLKGGVTRDDAVRAALDKIRDRFPRGAGRPLINVTTLHAELDRIAAELAPSADA